MRKKNKTLSDTALATTIAIATGVLTAGCVLFGAEHAPTPAAASIDAHAQADPEPAATPTAGEKASDQAQVEAAPSPVATASAASDAEPAPIIGPASVTSARAAGPVYADNMTLETPTLSFSAEFPAGAHKHPAYQMLMREMDSYRASLRTQAAAAEAAAREEAIPFSPWTIDIVFEETARAGNLISIIGREYANQGGAHPNSSWRGVIANIDTGEELAFSELFMPRKANSPAFAIGLCEALKTAKTERIGEAEIDGDPINCGNPAILERLRKADIALTPSTEPGEFGGARAYFGPYDVGVYAEGPYVVTVAQEVFATDLRPDFKPLFAGRPVQQD